MALGSERRGLLSARNLAPMAALCVFEVTPPGLLLHLHLLGLGRELLRPGVCGEAGGHTSRTERSGSRGTTPLGLDRGIEASGASQGLGWGRDKGRVIGRGPC